MHRLRMLVLAVLLALVAAACSAEVLPDDPGTPVPSPAPGEVAPDADATADDAPDAGSGDQADPVQDDGDQAGGGSTDSGAADGGEQGGGSDGFTGGTDDPKLSALSDGGPVGANAAAYLRGDRPRVVLEVDVQDGAQLPSGVLDHLRSVFGRESAATVELVTGPATGTRRDAWTADQLRVAAAETRTVAHDDGTAVLQLLVLRDGYTDDGVLGLAFGSSAAVVFPDQWSDLATGLLSGDRIARAVSTHEVGHLLGLVGLYEPPTSDHEDPDHPGHTTDREDVMHYAVERDIISQLDGIPTDFGPRTRADLAAIREG